MSHYFLLCVEDENDNERYTDTQMDSSFRRISRSHIHLADNNVRKAYLSTVQAVYITDCTFHRRKKSFDSYQ